MRELFKNNWQILLSELLVILVFVAFYGKFGDFMVDSFREVYIPEQLLKGKALYKDIFVIYPPLAYFINSLLVKAFGQGLITFYLAGLFSTLGIMYCSYKIAKMFLDKNGVLGILLFLIAAFALSPNVFSSFFPYSYGILYGMLFALLAVFFVINKKYPLGYLFCALAILCKYEFLLLFLLFPFVSKKNNWIKNTLFFIFPILLSLAIIYLQGVNFFDFKAAFNIVSIMSGTKTLYWFYSVMGLTFRLELLPIYAINFIKILIPFLGLQLLQFICSKYRLEEKFGRLFLIPIIFLILFIFSTGYQEILIYAFPLILLLFVFRFKWLGLYEKFIVLATLLISSKVFFALTLQSYGVYFLPFALISLFILVPKNLRRNFSIIIILWAIIIGIHNGVSLLRKDSHQLDNVVEYVKFNTQKTDKVFVYPECLGINILSGRESDSKLYSLIPLYVETFGEDLIISRLTLIKPECIIINNYDTSAYYYKEFGKDYAQNILKWIEKNYILETIIKDNWEFKVYRLKLK